MLLPLFFFGPLTPPPPVWMNCCFSFPVLLVSALLCATPPSPNDDLYPLPLFFFDPGLRLVGHLSSGLITTASALNSHMGSVSRLFLGGSPFPPREIAPFCGVSFPSTDMVWPPARLG